MSYQLQFRRTRRLRRRVRERRGDHARADRGRDRARRGRRRARRGRVQCRRARGRALRPLIGAYVEAIRNTPFVVQLFFIFFGLPALGVHIDEYTAAILAMTLNLGAYSVEIVRAGVAAVPKGHLEAASALAMSRAQMLRHVVLPQALAKVFPALSSQIVITMLGSAVVSQISVADLTYAAGYIQSRNFRAFETYFVITLAYLAMALLMRATLGAMGRRLFSRRVRGAR